jgi:hypothetical protein
MVQGTIDQMQVTKFRDNVHVLAQQTMSRLRPYVEFIDPKPGDVMAYDRIGSVEARQITGRYTAATFDDLAWSRRALSRQEFFVNLPVSTYDVEGMLADPRSKLAQECVYAMQRTMDRVILQAMFATVNTGRNFETAVTAAADGVVTVDMTSGITFPKLLTIDQNFIDNEVDNGGERRKVIGITGEESTAILQIAQLTQSFYTNYMQIDSGVVKRMMDFDVVRFGGLVGVPMLPVVAGIRTGFAMVEGAIAMGLWRDMSINVEPRYDLVDTVQINCLFTLGAVRTEGVLIQKCTYTV